MAVADVQGGAITSSLHRLRIDAGTRVSGDLLQRQK
jgi:hypothetical protein